MDSHIPPAAHRAIEDRATTRALQTLTGLVQGIVADGMLNSLEVQFLSAWLEDNVEATREWPGNAIHRKVREVLADGVITNDERAHLLQVLQDFVGGSFVDTGSAAAEVASLPYDHHIEIQHRDRGICMTGEFAYGTRAHCEATALAAGATPYDAVTKKVHFLVVGTRVSPAWVNTSYGRKIQKALTMRDAGHGIYVVSEERWVSALPRL